jgi:hypothetical protein
MKNRFTSLLTIAVFAILAGCATIVNAQYTYVATSFGVQTNGAYDQTQTIQNALDTIGDNQTLYFPAGNYKVSGTIKLTRQYQTIMGAGRNVTKFIMAPTANGQVLFQGGSGTSTLLNGMRFTDFTVTSTDTTYTKTGIQLTHVSYPSLERINMEDIVDSSGGSIGFHLKGKECGVISDCSFESDKPIFIDKDPYAAGLEDLGVYTFRDCYAQGSTSTNYCVTIADGAFLANINFAGNLWMGKGGGGIWACNSGTSTPASVGLKIENGRYEQPNSTSAWAIYMNRKPSTNTAGNLKHFLLDNFQLASGCNGMYLRNVWYTSIRNMLYAGTQTALDVDNTCYNIALQNCWFSDAPSTVSLGGLQKVFALNKVNPGSPAENTVVYAVSATPPYLAGADIQGALSGAVTTGGTSTLGQWHQTYLVNAAAQTITLPDPTTCSGRIYTVKVISPATSVSIATSGGNIEGAASPYNGLNAVNAKATFQSNGTGWWIVGN